MPIRAKILMVVRAEVAAQCRNDNVFCRCVVIFIFIRLCCLLYCYLFGNQIAPSCD